MRHGLPFVPLIVALCFSSLSQAGQFIKCYTCLTGTLPADESPEMEAIYDIFDQRNVDFDKIETALAGKTCEGYDLTRWPSLSCKYSNRCYEMKVKKPDGKLFVVRGCGEKFLTKKAIEKIDKVANNCVQPNANISLNECTCQTELCTIPLMPADAVKTAPTAPAVTATTPSVTTAQGQAPGSEPKEPPAAVGPPPAASTEAPPTTTATAATTAKPTTETGPESAACTDKFALCPFWTTEASQKQCTANPDWMSKNCPAACSSCTPKQISLNDCTDVHESCSGWASLGECTKNTHYMFWKCPKACQFCSKAGPIAYPPGLQ